MESDVQIQIEPHASEHAMPMLMSTNTLTVSTVSTPFIPYQGPSSSLSSSSSASTSSGLFHRPLHEFTAAWHTPKHPHSHTPKLMDPPIITTIKRLDRFLGGFPTARVSLLEGYHDFLLNMIARIIVHTVKCSNRDVIYIDGGNTLDPYLLTSSCRLFKQNADHVLRHVQVARAFTVFQLDTLITQSLEQILVEHNPKLVLVSCFSELYLDRDVDWSEAKILFTSGFDKLESLTEQYGITTIVTDFGRDKSIHRFELSRRLRNWLPPENRVSLKRPSQNRLRFVKGTGEFLDYLPLPPYQWSLDDFYPGGDVCG